MSNSAKGRHSYDSTSTSLTINFFNRNVSEYPTEAGSVKFDLMVATDERLKPAVEGADDNSDVPF